MISGWAKRSPWSVSIDLRHGIYWEGRAHPENDGIKILASSLANMVDLSGLWSVPRYLVIQAAFDAIDRLGDDEATRDRAMEELGDLETWLAANKQPKGER